MARAATRELSRRASSGTISVATAGKSGEISLNARALTREDASAKLKSRTSNWTSSLRLPRRRKFKSLVVLASVSLSAFVIFGDSGTKLGKPGKNTGMLVFWSPNAVKSRMALSRLNASIPLTASSSKNSRKKEPSAERTNCSASRVAFSSAVAGAGAFSAKRGLAACFVGSPCDITLAARNVSNASRRSIILSASKTSFLPYTM
mmetsp:Transcript_575/g.2347  ORF Transcript_575/g.2347 Transcript_575/m.2347 type:complete len:205 (+) Transcript_575:118-732(+)